MAMFGGSLHGLRRELDTGVFVRTAGRRLQRAYADSKPNILALNRAGDTPPLRRNNPLLAQRGRERLFHNIPEHRN